MPQPSVTFVAEIGIDPSYATGTARGTIVPELCVPETDVVLTSVLLTWADILAGPMANEATFPRVCMTLDLDVRVLRRPPTGEVALRSEVLKSGRTASLTETRFLDASGETFAISFGTFVASPRPQDDLDVDVVRGPRWGRRPLQIPLPERLGVRVVQPGVAEVDRRDDLLNPADTLQGGVVALLAEVAALSVAPGGAVRDLDVRYLRATRVGPARATAEVVGSEGPFRTVRVEVRDAGDGDRLTAVVRAICGPPASHG